MEDWKKEFKKYLFHPNPDSMEIDKAENIVKNHTPKKLYKYKSFNQHSVDNLKNDQVYCRKPSEFNDPYDTSMKASFDEEAECDSVIQSKLGELLIKYRDTYLDASEIDRLQSNKKWDDASALFVELMKEKGVLDSLTDEYDNLREEYDQKEVCDIATALADHFNRSYRDILKISCFSEDRFSMPMWCHYANNHQGFVIEYNFESIHKMEYKSVLLFPVIYELDRFDPLEYARNLHEKNEINPIIDIAASIHKAKDWSYEKEWRLIIVRNSDSGNETLLVPTPRAIYLGADMKQRNEARLTNIAKRKEIKVYKMEISKADFTMTSKQIL